MIHSGEARRSRILWLWLSLLGLAFVLSACGKDEGIHPQPPDPPVMVNLPPTASAGLDQLVLTGASVSLAGTGTDPDGSITTYAWTQTAGTNVTLTGANSATASFTAPPAAGDLTFQLSVTDNSGAARTDTLIISVNAAPVASAGIDQSVSAGASVTLNGAGSDSNGTVAAYAWTQVSGSVVTLSSTSVAAPTFTAPASATTLEFRLTVTDNQGATHFDTVTINVSALTGPVIARHPVNTLAHEHGAALLFVVAEGENLNYEWHGPGGILLQSGPEPTYMRVTPGGLSSSDDDDCFYVVVSNSAGSVTSQPGCLTVVEAGGDLDPYDDNFADDESAAVGYGNVMLAIARQGAGLLTGATLFGRFAPGRGLETPISCGHSGQFVGTTLDGQNVTTAAFLPLGHHTVSWHWDECRESPDDLAPLRGAILVTYDFPTVFGVGTQTIHLSGYGYGEAVMNGTLEVTTTTGVGANGAAVDDIEITLGEDFCAGGLRQTSTSHSSIALHRRLNSDATFVPEATLDFDVIFDTFDSEGYAGPLFVRSGGSDVDLHHVIQEGDNGLPDRTSEDEIVIGLIDEQPGSPTFTLATIVAGEGNGDWVFHALPPPEPGGGN